MRFPTPPLSEYAINTAFVVLTLAVLQYTGWLSDDPAGLEPAFLAVVAVTFPAFSYLIALVGANVRSNAE
ncbi:MULTISPECIES: hypothetical protein [Halorubrum]|uniref:Uncharacterized protein n=1 Tax=Halorubrum sodomense TaxID=35743 RepID=A0A1I6GXQ4_HALSD|nr:MULTISPECIES: hypothetical protein [Halorubrum]TKX54807.1 hypothetical protein EXE42_06745 [Halorubrum sp. SP3]TKX69916.1 hypothetical protein EXE45_06895 [Halorubrum sp. SP9]SFR46936.1 hypothetical protein SAMN04487937_2160 [Halorubrum sodomense]